MTLWYSALLLVTLVLFGGGIFLGLRTVLYDNFAEQVRQDAALVLAGVTTAGTTLSLDPSTIAGFDDGERFVRVVAADGTVVVDTSDREDIPAAALPNLDPQSARREFHQLRVGDETFGLAIAPVLENGSVVGAVQVGISRADIDETLRVLSIAYAIAVPILLCTALAGGYLISGRALAPVREITQMAASIEADDLGTRLDLDLPDDELGRLADTFDAMLQRIEAAFERQRQFTGDAAHELRTPLSLMRSQVDLTLSRPRPAEEYQDALLGIRGDIERLTIVVGTLLALARADSGNLRVARERSDLGTIMKQVLASYAPQAQRAGITLIDETTTTIVDIDEDLVVQLLVNLIDNALAHTPQDGTVSIGCGVRSDVACMWVTDTGTGIAPEHLDRIFERFYRVDSGRARAQGGTGLGLAFCKAIAEAHGGSLEVTSTPGHGSRFEFCFAASR